MNLDHLVGLVQGFLLALPFYLTLDRVLDIVTRGADGVGPTRRA